MRVKSDASYESYVRKTRRATRARSIGVPLFRGQAALYYNTEMFAKAGLSGPPKTMADYTEYAKKLTQRDAAGNPTVSGWSLRLSGGGQGIAEKFWINLHQYGGALLKQTRDGKWIADYDNAGGSRDAQAVCRERRDVQKTVTPQMKADAEAFELEQTAMFIRESWVIGDIKQKAPNLKYATAPLPKGSIALVTNLYVTTEGEKGKARLGIRQGDERAGEPRLAARQRRLAAEPQGRRLLQRTSEDAGASAPSCSYPTGYTFFTLPAIAPIEEILTRLAARLTRGYTRSGARQGRCRHRRVPRRRRKGDEHHPAARRPSRHELADGPRHLSRVIGAGQHPRRRRELAPPVPASKD